MKKTKMHWAADIFAGVSGLLALGGVMEVVPLSWIPWVGLGIAATGYVGKWLEQHVPARVLPKKDGDS